MGFFVLGPEESGRPAGGPVSGGELSCVFDTWLGDDLVRAHPHLLVTTPLKEALAALRRGTGFSLTRAHAIASPFFERHNPGRRLPTFWSVDVRGRPGVDDLGFARDGSVVASARVVDVLGRFALKHATLSQYVASSEEAPGPPTLATR